MEEKNKDIFTLIPKIMGECGSIGKKRKNQGQGYNFRGIDDVYLALQKILANHGVFCVPEVLEVIRSEKISKNGNALLYTVLKIKYIFYATDGSFFEAIVTGEGMDSGDKSANKAMSVAQKYALLQVFCIPTEEAKDPEHDNQQLVPSKNTSQEPSATSQGTKQPTEDTFKDKMGKACAEFVRLKHDKEYFTVLGGLGYENSDEVPKDKEEKVLQALRDKIKELKESK